MSKITDMILDGLKLGVQIVHLDKEHAEALVDEMYDAKDLVRRMADYLKDVTGRVEHNLPYRLDSAIREALAESETMLADQTLMPKK